MQNFQYVIKTEKEISPGPEAFAARQAEIALFGAKRIELVQLLVTGQRTRRFEMVDDRERNQHRPAPGRHFVDVKRRPCGQQNHFHWNGRQIFPRELSEKREVKFAERVHAGNASETQDVLARFAHEREIGRVTGELEGEVTFDRRVDLARPAEVNVPAAVGQLPFQNVTNAAFLEINVDLAQPVHKKHEVRTKRAIDQEFAAPMTVLALLSKKILLRARNGVGNFSVSCEEGLRALGARAS